MSKTKRPLAPKHVWVWDGLPDFEIPAYTKGEARAILKDRIGPLWGIKVRKLRTVQPERKPVGVAVVPLPGATLPSAPA